MAAVVAVARSLPAFALLTATMAGCAGAGTAGKLAFPSESALPPPGASAAGNGSPSAPATQDPGCGDVVTVPPFPGDRDSTHEVPPPPLAEYPSVPPASGPHDPIPWPAGIYPAPPPVGRVIHSLEHGAVIVWLSPDASGPAVAGLHASFARPEDRDHVIVALFDYPGEGGAGRLPEGSQMALVAWHRLQLCAIPSEAAAVSFVHSYATAPGSEYVGEAPEPGAPI